MPFTTLPNGSHRPQQKRSLNYAPRIKTAIETKHNSDGSKRYPREVNPNFASRILFSSFFVDWHYIINVKIRNREFLSSFKLIQATFSLVEAQAAPRDMARAGRNEKKKQI
jgi:hypothetical protein